MNAKTDTLDTETESNVQPENPWLRLLYLILFAVIFNIAELVFFVVVIIQFICKVATGQVNDRLRAFGHNLAVYARDIIDYMTFYNDRKPFPFRAWPGSSSSTS